MSPEAPLFYTHQPSHVWINLKLRFQSLSIRRSQEVATFLIGIVPHFLVFVKFSGDLSDHYADWADGTYRTPERMPM